MVTVARTISATVSDVSVLSAHALTRSQTDGRTVVTRRGATDGRCPVSGPSFCTCCIVLYLLTFSWCVRRVACCCSEERARQVPVPQQPRPMIFQALRRRRGVRGKEKSCTGARDLWQQGNSLFLAISHARAYKLSREGK